MKFKTPALEFEFTGLHPDVRKKLIELDIWSVDRGFPEVVITEAFRTPAQMEATYWKSIAAKLATELPEASPAAREAVARSRARAKFSWHLVRCAADIRNRHYTPIQGRAVLTWLKDNCVAGFEVVQHDVGRGDHIHLGKRDPEWKARHLPSVKK